MDSFIDRLAEALVDPRTDLVLLLGLWVPAIVLVLAVLALVVWLACSLARDEERLPSG